MMSSASMDALRDSPHLLITAVHGSLLRRISDRTGVHFAGLTQAAHSLRRRGADSRMVRRLTQIDAAFNMNRHTTIVSASKFQEDVDTFLCSLDGEDTNGTSTEAAAMAAAPRQSDVPHQSTEAAAP